MTPGPGEDHALLLLNVKCLAEGAWTIKAVAAALGWRGERRGSWLSLLFLSLAQVSAALPIFLATGVERGPACWVGGGWSWGVWERSVCACRCERFKGPILIFWPQLPEKEPLRLGSGACAIFQTLPVFIFYFFLSVPFPSLSYTVSFLPCSTWLWDTNWVNETWD